MMFQHSTSNVQHPTPNGYRGIFDVGCWALSCLLANPFGVGSFFYSKKVPPPTPDRREGRLFPPEQSWKTSRLLNELLGRRNKILHEIFRRSRGLQGRYCRAGRRWRIFRLSAVIQLAQAVFKVSSFYMRNLDDGSRGSLAGSLLVAHPNMLDPNFRRAVLFISAHDPKDGAIGIIINRPLDKNVSDLVSETPPENLADVPVFFGGPVGSNQLMLAAFEWQKGEGLKLNQHSLDADEAIAKVS